MTRILAGLAVIAAMNLPAHGQALKMSGTWEIVSEKSTPRPRKLCSNSWIAGLKGEPCVRAMPQLVIDEAPNQLTVTGAVVNVPTPMPAMFARPLELRDAFAPIDTIDRQVTLAIRSTDAIVVRAFSPGDCGAWDTTVGLVERPAEWHLSPGPAPISTGATSYYPMLPGPALQCLELRFTLDRSGDLTIHADKGLLPRIHQVYRRVK